jgi:hypothetical protein
MTVEPASMAAPPDWLLAARLLRRDRSVTQGGHVARTAGDWGWRGVYNKSVFAPMTDEQAREEGGPV